MKQRINPPIVAFDCDDVLADCNAAAMAAAGVNESIDKLTTWNNPITPLYEHIFHSPDFFRTQKVFKGARECVDAVRHMGAKVIFVTAVCAEVASARIEWLIENFNASASDVIIASRKDLVSCDILVDDNPRNIVTSIAKWPILFRRPWNHEITGTLAVNSFDDLLEMISAIISRTYRPFSRKYDILCLVGPSGAGKTEIAAALHKQGFAMPTIFTTAEKHTPNYTHISKEEFANLKEDGVFLETSCYAGDNYGIVHDDFERVLTVARRLVIPIDICGANALRRIYGERVRIVYISRPKDVLIEKILQKDIGERCKVLRILALDAERKNASLCDYEVENSCLDTTINEILTVD